MSLIHSMLFLVACAGVQPFLFPGSFRWIPLPGIQLPGSGSGSGSGGSGSGCITQMGCIEGGPIQCDDTLGCPTDDNTGNGILCYWPNNQTGCGSTPPCACANQTTTRFFG